MAEAKPVEDAESGGHSLIQDMMESGLIVKSPDKPKTVTGKSHKGFSDLDKFKVTEMVKSLAKFKEMEEDFDSESDVVSKKGNKGGQTKSPNLKSNKENEGSNLLAGSLSHYIKSEMSDLTAELNISQSTEPTASSSSSSNVNKKNKTKDLNQEVSNIDVNSGRKVASVSLDMQNEFLLLQEKQEQKNRESSASMSGELPVVNLMAGFMENASDHDSPLPEKPTGVTVNKEATGHPPSKKEKKKEKKTKNKESPEKEVVGSYTQLLKTLGKQQSPRRNFNDFESESINSPPITTKADDGPSQETVSKKKRKHEKEAGGPRPAAVVVVPKQEEIKIQGKKGKGAKGGPDKPGSVTDKDGQASPGPEAWAADKTGKKKKKKEKSPKPEKSSPESSDVGQQSRPTSGKKQRGKKKGQQQLQDSSLHNQQAPGVAEEMMRMEVTVPKQEHRFVAGPQYRHVQDIFDITGVVIKIPPANTPSETIVVIGDKLQLGPAVALMFSKSEQARREANSKGIRPVHPQEQGQVQKGKVKGQARGHDIGMVDAMTAVNLGVDEAQGQEWSRSDNPNWRQNKGPTNVGKHKKDHHIGPHLPVYQHGAIPAGVKGHHHSNYQHGKGQDCRGQSGAGAPKKRKNIFTEYLSKEEVSEGLKKGVLIEGPIRINPKNYEEAYVPHPDGKSDILIGSFKHRNRALNGDIVAVELMLEGDWKFNTDELKDYEESLKQKQTAGNSDSSDDEVLIESEETIVHSQGQSSIMHSAASSISRNDESSLKSPVKGNNQTRTPHKGRFTSLDEVLETRNVQLRSRLSSDSGERELRKMLQRTGKVVAIIEARHARACTGHIKFMTDKRRDKALFCPNDHRMPRIIIPMENCPPDFLERSEDYLKTLYVGRVTNWRVDSMMADGCLQKSLGEAGEIEPETEGMLIENGIDFDEFPQEALNCLPTQSPWTIPAEEFEYRRDFRNSCVFTIDPATARDLDDALSCETLDDGRYKIGVHIADVSFFIKENSALDTVASLRATSVYLVHKVIPMLPRLLCEQLCSLNPDEDRLSFSVEWIINADGEIEDEWFGRSVIRSCVKLSYDHAQGFIEEPDRFWTQEELPPISEGFTVEDIKSRVLILNKLAVKLRKGRMDSGALRLDQVKLQYSLDKETGMPNGYWVYQQRDSNKLVEEFMLLANMAVAHRINSEFPDKAMLRRHPPPQEKMVDTLRDQCSALGIHLDTTSAGSLQRSLWNYYGDDDYDMARMQVLVALCAKPMQNAKYFCTGCIDDESLYHHYALNVPLYTHFTSPIRRFPDIMVHRLLAASLDYSKETSKSSGDIHKIAENCNEKKTAAKRVGDLSSELFFAVFVKVAGPLEEKAMVMGVMDKSFDIFVLKLGVSKRVYLDKLDVRKSIYRRERKVPSLILVWNVAEGEPEVRQEITIFSVVDAVLQKGELPLQWTATIKKPQSQQYFAPGMSFEDLPEPGLQEEVDQSEECQISGDNKAANQSEEGENVTTSLEQEVEG